MARPRLRLAARGRSTCARGHVDRPETRWGVASGPARSQRPARPGWGAVRRGGCCFGPAAARLHSVPIGKQLLRVAPGRTGAGGSGSGTAVLLTPQPARWLRAARDLGRTLPGGVGSREEGVSSHPPGWPRGGPRRGGTQAGRKPVGARPAAVPCPRSQPTPGLGRPR